MEAKTLQIITNELYKYGKLIKEDEVKEVVELCQKANRIFIAGAGRSGFCARGFANRMMHLGISAFIDFVGGYGGREVDLSVHFHNGGSILLDGKTVSGY